MSILGINASRARSGGGTAHLLGILGESEVFGERFSQVHLWAPSDTLELLPDWPWLNKHSVGNAEGSLFRELIWERFSLSRALRKHGCRILLNVDAGNVCKFGPAVTMCRDMLPFDKRQKRLFGLGRDRLRLEALRALHCRSLSRATGVISLTQHSKFVIEQFCRPSGPVTVIPHGINRQFDGSSSPRDFRAGAADVHLMYVSPVQPYKHHEQVIEAVCLLRDWGKRPRLSLIGQALNRHGRKIESLIRKADPEGKFIDLVGPVDYASLPSKLAEADVIIFASTCETLPNALLEAMRSEKPIACSDRTPMPQVLQDGGLYFDARDPHSIAVAIDTLIVDPDRAQKLAKQAQRISTAYSWEKCATETVDFLVSLLSDV